MLDEWDPTSPRNINSMSGASLTWIVAPATLRLTVSVLMIM